MNSEQIIKSDVLDILFENRNKMYGAYDLRKFYNNRLYKALGVMLAGVVIFAAFSFITPSKPKIEVIIPDQGFVTVKAEIKETPPPEEPKQQPKAQAPQTQFTSNIQVVDNKAPDDTLRTLDPSVYIGTSNISPKPGDVEPVVGVDPGPGPGLDPGPVTPPTPEPEPVINPEIPIDNPDVLPQFPGGRLSDYLQRHLTNPKDMEEGEKVRVVIKFVVGYDGKLKGFEIEQDGGEEFNKEVIRVFKRMPAWTPGKTKGKNVSVNYRQSVLFTPAE